MSAPTQNPQNPWIKWSPLVLALGVILILNSILLSHYRPEEIPYSQFLELVARGQVTEVSLSDTLISGRLKSSPDKTFATVPVPVPDNTLIKTLQKHDVEFKAEARHPFWESFASWVVPILLIWGVWIYLFGRMSRGAQGGLLSMAKSRARVHMETDVHTTFADVAGVDEVKDELREAVDFLRDPKGHARLGGRAPKGILLIGPPGTGKTLMARAVAGEAHVPFFSINGSEFVELFVGLGAARVRDLFSEARKQAPCIIFIDEIDALGKSRAMAGLVGSSGNDEKEQTLNQLLAEMDGFDPSEGIIMLAATNRPEILDPALLRAGRFDRQVLFPNPDQAGRLQILQVHARKIVLDPQTDLKKIAAMTSGFSGADLANLVNEAALVATRRDGDAVTEKDFSQAIERLVAGLEKKSHVMNPREKERIAYHELGHTTVAIALNCTEKVHKVSIVPRGMGALGYTLQRPTEDRYVLDEEELLDKIAVLLGGRASEKLKFGRVSTGAVDDLAKATDLARAMIAQYGMNSKIGMASLEGRPNAQLPSPYDWAPRMEISEKTAASLDDEIQATLNKAFQRALHCLRLNETFIAESFKKLIQSETLEEIEIVELWKKFGHLSQDMIA